MVVYACIYNQGGACQEVLGSDWVFGRAGGRRRMAECQLSNAGSQMGDAPRAVIDMELTTKGCQSDPSRHLISGFRYLSFGPIKPLKYQHGLPKNLQYENGET